VISTVLLHPLPFHDSGRLTVLWAKDRTHGDQQVELSYRDLTEWQRRSRAFEGLAALSSVNLDVALTGGDRPQQIEGMLVTDGLFDLLGARAELGRTPTASDVQSKAALGVISHRLWQSRFAGDRQVIGRTITADHQPCTVVGVMPPDFDFPHNVDLWFPGSAADLSRNATIRVYRVMGRLRAGRTLAQSRGLRQSASGAVGIDGGGSVAAVDGLRQRRQPAVEPRDRARARDATARRARRQ